MKHLAKKRKLNRTSSHRKALLINMANSLIDHGRIKTTLPKAKTLRPYVEKLITLGKKDNLHSRRALITKTQNKDIVNKLCTDLSKKFEARNGGYTRILKMGFRYGDSAPMAIIELVN